MAAADQLLIYPRRGRKASSAPDPAGKARPLLGGARANVPPLAGVYALARMDVRLVVSDDLASLEMLWRRFEAVADCTVFQAFDWLATWQKHVGRSTGVRPLIVVGHDAAGEPLIILPLAILRHRGLRRLTFLGRDLSDYNAPLLAPDFTQRIGGDFPALWRAVRDLLQSTSQHRHDLVVLDKMPESVGAQPNPFLELGPALNPSHAYQTALPGDWETFYAARRSAVTRRRDRTKLRRLGEHGTVAMVTPAGVDDTAATVAALLAQKRRALARMGVADLFSRPGYEAFFHALAALPGDPRLAHVSRLQVGEAFAATNLGLQFRGTYHHVLASYDDGLLARLGPGVIHLHELMRHALEQGCTVFDFTIGDEPYKRDWSDKRLKLYDFMAGSTPPGWAVAASLDLVRGLKRRLKQSPRLWPLLLRLRAAVGGKRAAAPPPGGD